MTPSEEKQSVRPERVRMVVVGLGEAAQKIHLPALAKLPEIDLVGGCDPDPEARGRFQKEFRGISTAADPARLLEETKPDWALVASPPATHVELCLLALSHGCHVFCEKPLADRVGDVDRVMNAATAAGRVVAVNHEFPRMPIFEALLGQIGQEGFGRPLFFHAWENIYYPPSQEKGWRAGGHTMREFGTHVVDLAMNVFGGAPDEVFARMPDPLDSRGSDPIDVVSLGFPGQCGASIVISRVSRGPRRYLEVRLDGERASLRASIGGRARASISMLPGRWLPRLRIELAAGGQAWRESGDRVKVLARNPLDAFADATARQLRAVLLAVREGREPPASAAWARRVVAVVEAAYRSAREGVLVRTA